MNAVEQGTSGSADLTLRAIESPDLPAILELNNAVVPHVNELDLKELEGIVDSAALALVLPGMSDSSPAVAGFVIALAPHTAYGSPNYRYFSERFDQFRYVDRIAVDPSGHRGGVGRLLYDAVIAHAAEHEAQRVCCEVNIDPPNPVSQAFHARMGFEEVGRQENYGGDVIVQMLVHELADVES